VQVSGSQNNKELLGWRAACLLAPEGQRAEDQLSKDHIDPKNNQPACHGADLNPSGFWGRLPIGSECAQHGKAYDNCENESIHYSHHTGCVPSS
jgi:hypothetical protein